MNKVAKKKVHKQLLEIDSDIGLFMRQGLLCFLYSLVFLLLLFAIKKQTI